MYWRKPGNSLLKEHNELMIQLHLIATAPQSNSKVLLIFFSVSMWIHKEDTSRRTNHLYIKSYDKCDDSKLYSLKPEKLFTQDYHLHRLTDCLVYSLVVCSYFLQNIFLSQSDTKYAHNKILPILFHSRKLYTWNFMRRMHKVGECKVFLIIDPSQTQHKGFDNNLYWGYWAYWIYGK